jgi:hypothetical protein
LCVIVFLSLDRSAIVILSIKMWTLWFQVFFVKMKNNFESVLLEAFDGVR